MWAGKKDDHIAALTGHSDTVNSVIFFTDGVRLASSSTRRFDCGTNTFDHIATLEGHFVAVYSIALHCQWMAHDSRLTTHDSRLASASGDETVRFVDGKTGNPVVQLRDSKNGDHAATLKAILLRCNALHFR